jgi:NAD(P)-dependent dehydrogenase (short-subunit alcohol dehydrogenase family)
MSSGSRFAGKVAVVTGGASGIGRATVERLASEGASVVVVDRDARQGSELVAAPEKDGATALFVCTSVTDEAEVISLYEKVHAVYGRVDVLVNCAGIARESYGETTSLEDWRAVLDVNLGGVFLMSKHAIAPLRAAGGGAIVNVGSILSSVGTPGGASYVASKHAVEGLTKAFALEHATEGIRVNAVCPGYVHTPLIQQDLDASPGLLESMHPMGRLAEPSEIAAVIAFMASDDASFVTGASYLVDGGYTAQ